MVLLVESSNVIKDLCVLYDNLEEKGKLRSAAYMKETYSYIICLTEDGELDAILPCKEKAVEIDKKTGKAKEKTVKKELIVPSFASKNGTTAVPEKRFVQIFGSEKDKKQDGQVAVTKSSKKKNNIFKKDVADFFDDLDSPLIHAYKEFAKNWDPESGLTNEILQNHRKNNSDAETEKYLFCLTGEPGKFLQDDPLLKEKWENTVANAEGDSNYTGYCSITGEYGPISRVHDKIKGPGTAFGTIGCALTCCNDESTESYGQTQSNNCGVSVKAMQKYTRALNYLVEHRDKYCFSNGDNITIFWSNDIESDAENAFAWLLYDRPNEAAEVTEAMEDVKTLLKNTRVGLVAQKDLNYLLKKLENIDFHIMEVRVENSSRASIRDYRTGTFSEMLMNIVKFQNSLALEENNKPYHFNSIVKAILPVSDKPETNPEVNDYLFKDIQESAFRKGYVSRTLAETTLTRAMAEGYLVNKDGYPDYRFLTRVAIFKSYLIGKGEELNNMLNENCANKGYLCGRLLAVYDKLQKDANYFAKTQVNKTYADIYMRLAIANPARAFNIISAKTVYDFEKLRKNNGGKTANDYEKLINEIIDKIDTNFPKHLNTVESSAFYVGFRQQQMVLYTKKDKSEDENNLTEE